MEKHLKEIASELKLIRKELQKSNKEVTVNINRKKLASAFAGDLRNSVMQSGD